MSRPFAVERLSRRSQELIERLYFDGVPVLRIPEMVKAETGECVSKSSLHRYCNRQLKSDWRVEAIRRYQRAVVDLMQGYSGLSRSKVELAAFLVAILGVQQQMLNEKLDQVNESIRDLKDSIGNLSKTGRPKAA